MPLDNNYAESAPTNQGLDDFNLGDLTAKLLRRRWIIGSAWLATVLGGCFYLSTTRPLFEASAMVNIEKERGNAGIYTNNGALIESKNEDYYQTQYRLLTRYSLIEKVHKDLQFESHPEFGGPGGVAALQRAVKIIPIARSRLLFVKAFSHDPRTAASIANTLSEAYVAENLSNQLFISKDVLNALQIEASNPRARRLYESLPNVVNSALIQGLKTDYFKLESQAAELSQKVTPKHPAMIALRSNMASLKAQLDVETDKIVNSLKAELSGQLRGNNVRVVEPARVPESPFKPNRKGTLSLSIIGGLLLGLALGLAIEALDQSVRTETDVENKLGLPFLALVPQGKRKSGERAYQALLSNEHSFTAESFRSLRTMVGFAGVDGKSKVMIVTSALESEGKSFVSCNLAVTFASLGEDVLVIDGDLRRPTIHKVLGISRERGISDFLAAGKAAAEVAGLVQDCDVKKLKVLCCGTKPPNPSELLNTPRVPALLAWASTHFDRVIVDTAPILPIHDTLLWARHIPSAVLVVRHGKTRSGAVTLSARKLAGAGAKVLGVVLNAAKPGGLAYTDRYYYYRSYTEAADRRKEPAPARSASS
ncbi:MAG: polysaccharide biosynthesis tyrosine autokinase [Elusimicrobia bacterium]|nr:polysaccharide biosynthesis tyrosine autokinase [Elusimicrobiota bacterium]